MDVGRRMTWLGCTPIMAVAAGLVVLAGVEDWRLSFAVVALYLDHLAWVAVAAGTSAAQGRRKALGRGLLAIALGFLTRAAVIAYVVWAMAMAQA